MELTQKKDYILRYVSKGLPLTDAYTMAYTSDTDRDLLDGDDAFQLEVKEIELELTDAFLERYNRTVSKSKSPADHLKRLQQFRPRVFSDEDKDKLPDLQITFHKKGPDEV